MSCTSCTPKGKQLPLQARTADETCFDLTIIIIWIDREPLHLVAASAETLTFDMVLDSEFDTHRDEDDFNDFARNGPSSDFTPLGDRLVWEDSRYGATDATSSLAQYGQWTGVTSTINSSSIE